VSLALARTCRFLRDLSRAFAPQPETILISFSIAAFWDFAQRAEDERAIDSMINEGGRDWA
jgi:hypothetical protein